MKRFLHLLRLAFEPHREGLMCYQPKRWQVKYHEGGITTPMSYRNACDYAEMYGGDVVRYKTKGGGGGMMLIELIAKLIAKPAVANWLIKRAMRTPDEHLDEYMNRYWLFNRYNRETRAPRFPWIPFSIRVHHILREDLDRHHHDHPWNARTIILRGAYLENRVGLDFIRGPGDTATLKFGEYHNIEKVSTGGAWTLFIMGRYRGRWGFLVDGKKIDFKTYLGDENVSS